jgi:hypothetical protein
LLLILNSYAIIGQRRIEYMTIAISMKVNDGIVLAADSAATILGRTPSGATGVVNIYDKANKVFNLRKGFPIGAITWGSGSIGQSSISTLAKDFRELITKPGPEEINPDNYTIQEIANKFKQFIFDQNYIEAFRDWTEKPILGFMIVGYSSRQPLAEEWKIDILNGQCSGPYIIRQQNEIGLTWNGEPEAITRLYLGFGSKLPEVLGEVGLEADQIQRIIDLCKSRLMVPMVLPPMPIQDAIDLAAFLVETTVQFSRFAPGAPTVGGPIEIAAITKHEGFKWVQRKHYFNTTLNPKEG